MSPRRVGSMWAAVSRYNGIDASSPPPQGRDTSLATRYPNRSPATGHSGTGPIKPPLAVDINPWRPARSTARPPPPPPNHRPTSAHDHDPRKTQRTRLGIEPIPRAPRSNAARPALYHRTPSMRAEVENTGRMETGCAAFLCREKVNSDRHLSRTGRRQTAKAAPSAARGNSHCAGYLNFADHTTSLRGHRIAHTNPASAAKPLPPGGLKSTR